jgi:carbonic anhydrase
MVDPRQIKTVSTKYYRYIGSLTVPPCTQNVLWTLVEEVYVPSQSINPFSTSVIVTTPYLNLNLTHQVRTVSKEQVKLLRKAVHDVSSMTTYSQKFLISSCHMLFMITYLDMVLPD